MESQKSVIYILDQGWIIAGRPYADSEECIYLRDANVVRSWSNGRGIGALAQAQRRAEYTLDFIGDCKLRQGRVIFQIPCEW